MDGSFMPRKKRPSVRMRQTQTTNLHCLINFSGVCQPASPSQTVGPFAHRQGEARDGQERSLRCCFDFDSGNRCRREQPSALVARASKVAPRSSADNSSLL